MLSLVIPNARSAEGSAFAFCGSDASNDHSLIGRRVLGQSSLFLTKGQRDTSWSKASQSSCKSSVASMNNGRSRNSNWSNCGVGNMWPIPLPMNQRPINSAVCASSCRDSFASFGPQLLKTRPSRLSLVAECAKWIVAWSAIASRLDNLASSLSKIPSWTMSSGVLFFATTPLKKSNSICKFSESLY